MEMLQTVVILIGKYQLKDDISCVVNQQVFLYNNCRGDQSSSNFINFFHGRYRNFNQILEVKNLDL